MKRSQHCRLSALIPLSAPGTGSTAGSGMERRFAAEPVPRRVGLSLRAESGTTALSAVGTVTGEHTAEADLTEALAGLAGASGLTVSGFGPTAVPPGGAWPSPTNTPTSRAATSSSTAAPPRP